MTAARSRVRTLAREAARIARMTDRDLADYIRAGESYRPHTPPAARVDLDARLHLARRERMNRNARPTR